MAKMYKEIDNDDKALRKDQPGEQPIFLIVLLAICVPIVVFTVISVPFEGIEFQKTALTVLIGLFSGLALYHIFIFVYDREGALYPVFIAEILTFCLYLYAEYKEQTMLTVISVIIAASLAALFTILLFKSREIDNIGKFYIITIAVSVLFTIVFILPIQVIETLFVPQVLPVTLVILSQCIVVESYDEHFLANRYFTVYKREQELAAENNALQIINDKRRDMMTTISHETRTPLAVISNFAALIAAEMRAEGVSEQRARDLDNLTEQIQNINEIMKQYADVAKDPTAPASTAVSAVDVINRTAQVYRHILDNAGIGLSLTLPDNLPHIAIQPGKLTQVLLNLMKNTARHSRGSVMTISAESFGTSFIVINVNDNGIGIESELLPNIFERGVSSNPHYGAGIGLAVCKDIVETAGGSITIKCDGGTKVTFTLPVYTEAEQ